MFIRKKSHNLFNKSLNLALRKTKTTQTKKQEVVVEKPVEEKQEVVPTEEENKPKKANKPKKTFGETPVE